MRGRRDAIQGAGFTLVEVLVALFVVALGVAGAAALQARAARTGRDAARLSAATQLAASLAERMRANPVEMALADADNAYARLDYDASAGPPPGAASCYAAACTPVGLAAFDLAEVAQDVAAQLPGGRIRVCRDAAPPDPVSGLLSWACDGRTGSPLAIKLGWHETGQPDAPRLLRVVGADVPAASP